MEIRGVLFDVNGTLIDIETDDWGEETLGPLKYFLRYHGVRLGRQELRSRLEAGVRHHLGIIPQPFPELDWTLIWRDVLAQAGVFDHGILSGDDTGPAERRYQISLDLARMHRSLARRRLRAFPKTHEMLDDLSRRYPLAIVTDGQWAFAREELTETGLIGYFRHVTVSGDMGLRKPDTRIFHDALHAIGVDASNAVYVGNDPYRDVHGAQASGMRAILVGDKSLPNWATSGRRPDYHIRHIHEVPIALQALASR